MAIFYEMEDDLEIKGRWFLNGLYDKTDTQMDSRYFIEGKPVPLAIERMPLYSNGQVTRVALPLTVSIRSQGSPLDITFADFDMPVCKRETSQLLIEHCGADVQTFPISVKGMTGHFDVLNVTNCIDCIDMEKSDLDLIEDDDPVRPDLAGTPMFISRLIITPNRIGQCQIFRLKGWEGSVIASERVKRILTKHHTTGINFTKVTL